MIFNRASGWELFFPIQNAEQFGIQLQVVAAGKEKLKASDGLIMLHQRVVQAVLERYLELPRKHET